MAEDRCPIVRRGDDSHCWHEKAVAHDDHEDAVCCWCQAVRCDSYLAEPITPPHGPGILHGVVETVRAILSRAEGLITNDLPQLLRAAETPDEKDQVVVTMLTEIVDAISLAVGYRRKRPKNPDAGGN